MHGTKHYVCRMKMFFFPAAFDLLTLRNVLRQTWKRLMHQTELVCTAKGFDAGCAYLCRLPLGCHSQNKKTIFGVSLLFVVIFLSHSI